MTQLSHWNVAVTDIPEHGLSRERAASAEDRDVLADALKLIALDSLIANYRIERLAGGAYRLSGRLKAACKQACVVTLDPVEAAVEETFDVEFWAEHQPDDDAGELPVLGGRDVEPLEGGIIDVGRIVYETLAAGLDPYPRKPGAEFDWADKTGEGSDKISPFSVLAKLKDKP